MNSPTAPSNTPRTDAHLDRYKWVGPREPETVDLMRAIERANAELLEALKAAKGEIQWWVDEHGCCAGHESDAMEIARAAIAKAEGK